METHAYVHACRHLIVAHGKGARDIVGVAALADGARGREADCTLRRYIARRSRTSAAERMTGRGGGGGGGEGGGGEGGGDSGVCTAASRGTAAASVSLTGLVSLEVQTLRGWSSPNGHAPPREHSIRQPVASKSMHLYQTNGSPARSNVLQKGMYCKRVCHAKGWHSNASDACCIHPAQPTATGGLQRGETTCRSSNKSTTDLGYVGSSVQRLDQGTCVRAARTRNRYRSCGTPRSSCGGTFGAPYPFRSYCHVLTSVGRWFSLHFVHSSNSSTRHCNEKAFLLLNLL